MAGKENFPGLGDGAFDMSALQNILNVGATSAAPEANCAAGAAYLWRARLLLCPVRPGL